MPERAYREGVSTTVPRLPRTTPRWFAVALVGLFVCAVSGCASQNVESVREKFVDAGGSCESWVPLEEPRAIDAIVCSDGAQIYLFDGDAERADVVKTELESNTDIRARTHIMLSGENWLVIDRITTIVKVMPQLHGIIQGRNGANP